MWDVSLGCVIRVQNDLERDRGSVADLHDPLDLSGQPVQRANVAAGHANTRAQHVGTEGFLGKTVASVAKWCT